MSIAFGFIFNHLPDILVPHGNGMEGKRLGFLHELVPRAPIRLIWADEYLGDLGDRLSSTEQILQINLDCVLRF
jgi:hypothetical protein